jgi:hypothetical protein
MLKYLLVPTKSLSNCYLVQALAFHGYTLNLAITVARGHHSKRRTHLVQKLKKPFIMEAEMLVGIYYPIIFVLLNQFATLNFNSLL